MAMFIEPCSLKEWAENAAPITGYLGSLDSYIAANVFSSMQFIEEEVELYKAHKAYKLVLSESSLTRDVAWLSVYFVSPRVLRVRGLIVLKDFRGRGLMSYLLKDITERYKNQADRIISFSLPSSLEFHAKFGFQIEPRFVPRCGDAKSDGEKLTLLVYDLNQINAESALKS